MTCIRRCVHFPRIVDLQLDVWYFAYVTSVEFELRAFSISVSKVASSLGFSFAR